MYHEWALNLSRTIDDSLTCGQTWGRNLRYSYGMLSLTSSLAHEVIQFGACCDLGAADSLLFFRV